MASATDDDDDLDKLLDSTLDDLEAVDKKHQIPKNVKLTNTKPSVTSTPILNTNTTTTTSTSTPSSSSSSNETGKPEEELAEKFAKDMTEMLKVFQGDNIEKNLEDLVKNMGLKLPESVGNEAGNEEDLAKILAAFATLDAQKDGSDDDTTQDSESGEASTSASITEKLKKIAENAKNIGDQEAGGEELEKMLQDFESNPEFQSVMEGMVNQMISKDVLYVPMKELREKYPKWLADNHATLSEEDYGKYIKQYDIVQKICCVYEASGDTTSPEQMQEVVQLMQDMAEYGQPPQAIIEELAPGVQIGPDGVPVLPGAEGDAANSGCSVM